MQYKYLTEKSLTVKEIIEIRNRAKVLFGNETFSDFSPTGEQFGGIIVKGKLLPLERNKGLNFLSFYIVGYLPVKDKSIDELFTILDKSVNDIGQLAIISIKIGFHGKNSEANKKYHDSIEFSMRKGKYFFEYDTMISDAKTRCEFFQDLIKKVELPLNIILKGDDFYIEHKDRGELFTSIGGFHGENPKFFRCEVSEEAFGNRKEYLRTVLETFATEKRYEYSWTLLLEDIGSETANRLYDLAVSKEFNASRCDIHFSFNLDKIEGLEVLHQWCAKKGHFLTFLCSFSLPEENSGELNVITKAKGHRLKLTLSDPEYLKLVEEKLGIKFKQY